MERESEWFKRPAYYVETMSLRATLLEKRGEPKEGEEPSMIWFWRSTPEELKRMNTDSLTWGSNYCLLSSRKTILKDTERKEWFQIYLLMATELAARKLSA